MSCVSFSKPLLIFGIQIESHQTQETRKQLNVQQLFGGQRQLQLEHQQLPVSNKRPMRVPKEQLRLLQVRIQ